MKPAVSVVSPTSLSPLLKVKHVQVQTDTIVLHINHQRGLGSSCIVSFYYNFFAESTSDAAIFCEPSSGSTYSRCSLHSSGNDVCISHFYDETETTPQCSVSCTCWKCMGKQR